MGFFDNVAGALKGILGQTGAIDANAMPALISAVLAKTDLGDLNGIVAKLQQAGLGNQVSSWLGDGSNLPVSPDQLRAALGNQQVQQLAEHFGLPIDAALKLLSQHLPQTVDQASPDGSLPPSR